jgi:hypothetical protein
MEDRITLAKLALLGAYFGGPVILASAVCQAGFLASRGLARAGNRARLLGWLLLTVSSVYVLTYVVWIGVPPKYLSWPGTPLHGFGFGPFMWLGIAFVPSLLELELLRDRVVVRGSREAAGAGERFGRI